MTGIYTTINLTMSIPVLGAAAIALWRLRGAERRRWLLGVGGSLVVLLVLTAIFDNLMIAAGLVAYDDALTSGLRLGLAPIEDFSYAIAAAVFVPSVWSVLTARTPAAVADEHTSPQDSGAGVPDSVRDSVPDRPAPPALLTTLFWSSRPVSWVNTAAPFALAYLLATGGFDLVGVIGTVFFLVPYNLAMYGINDVFDYESDLRNPRKGGVEGDVLDRRVHRTVILAAIVACLPFVVWLAVAGHPAVLPVLALSLFAVVAYSARGLRFKEIPFLDSLTSSTHFSSPAWVALAALGVWPTAAGWFGLGAFFLWGAASQAFGAVQDVGPDREAGIASIATVLGARATVWVALIGYAAAGLLALGTGPVLGWAALGALPYLVSVARFARITDDTSAQAHRGWVSFLWLNYAVGFGVTMLLLVHAGLLPPG